MPEALRTFSETSMEVPRNDSVEPCDLGVGTRLKVDQTVV